MEIKSYRAVFELERRIYRIDSLLLHPSGVPLRGLGYFAALLAAVLVLGALPLAGELVRMAPWYVRGLIAPTLGAAALTAIRVDGRASHLAAWALVRRGGGSWARWDPGGSGRRMWPGGGGRGMLPGARWRPADLVFVADGSDGRLRRLRYTGPGTVIVRADHVLHGREPGVRRRCARGAAVTLTSPSHGALASPLGTRGCARRRAVALEHGVRLEVRP